MSEIKNSGLDQYGAEPFEEQQFGTAGVERVNSRFGITNYTHLRKLGYVCSVCYAHIYCEPKKHTKMFFVIS